MANVSTARKLAILARVAAQQSVRTRTAGAVLQAARTTAVHWGKILHQLWLEVTGFVFLVLAVIGGFAIYREFALYRAGKADIVRVLVALCFTLMFAWFGANSFWRVRRRR